MMLSGAIHAQIISSNQPPRLSVLPSGPNGWLRVGGEFQDATLPPQVLSLEVSPDLLNWQPAAVLLQAPFRYEDPTWTDFNPRFYRLALTERSQTNDWANLIALPTHPFLQISDCDANVPLVWAKFAIVLAEPHRVYFQDSRKYLLHYDFAVNRLAPFHGMTPEQFNAVSLHRQNQQVILGAVLSPYDSFVDDSSVIEYGVQFVGLDPYPPEMVATLFELVRSTINTGPNMRVFYLPAFEQAEIAQENEAYFAGRGIEISSVARWTQGISACYAPGWALGRLKFVPALEINAAYADGRLGPDDILLTDGIPSEVPYVAGIISLAPATPNSHVAILAQSYGVPFVYLSEPAEQQRAQALAGREVMLRTGARLSACEIELLDVGSILDPALKQAILALKDPAELSITPKEPYGAISASTTSLVPADIRYFGGKAANFGLLRRTIPNHSHLDFEYKKVLPGQLRVKQVREIPLPDGTNQAPTFLLNKPAEYYVGGGAPSSVDPFAVHRLKSRWRLVTTNLALRETNLAVTFYSTAHVEFADGPLLQTLDGSPATWQNAAHSVTNGLAPDAWTVLDRWSTGAGASRRDFTLSTEVRRSVSPTESPLLTLADARLQCMVDYAVPVSLPGLNGTTMMTNRETVELFRFAWSSNTNPPISLTLVTNGLAISTTQKVATVTPVWHPGRLDCGYALQPSFLYVGLGGETRIEGLVSQPLVLRADYSQTYLLRGRFGHESFTDLICDPWLEPGLSPAVQAELTAANIRLIHFQSRSFGESTRAFLILGLDGQFRPLP